MPNTADIQAILQNEFKLRDYIVEHLDDLERGLRLLKKEYELPNTRGGAGGRTDILAADALDHIVVIEVKRSNKTAREATHELSKYISLLIERDRVPRELIRCVVVSTAWHELELPLAYFRATAQVDVIGMEVHLEGDELTFRQRELIPVSTLPQFSPEFSIYYYEGKSQYDTHVARIKTRAEQIPFARAASCLFSTSNADSEHSHVAIMCLWRIQPKDFDLLERAIGEPVGALAPYAYPGWEAECDCLSWLADETSMDCTIFYSAESERGTPEKAQAISSSHRFVQLDRFGDWPQLEIVNTYERILAQLTAVAALTGTPRRNRYQFEATASPKVWPSWEKTKNEFIGFLKGVPQWQEFVQGLCRDLEERQDVRVKFSALDKNHFFFALHQCTEHPEVGLSSFTIAAFEGEALIFWSEGSWSWDGSHTFGEAREEIEKVFGSVVWAAIAPFSAVDQNRYEAAYVAHGFHPYVRIAKAIADGKPVWNYVVGTPEEQFSLADFVKRYPDYVAKVSNEFRAVGLLATSPPKD